jgi:hypothetical protein
VSPLTGLSFFVIGVTGILMFFHIRFPGMTKLHELGGLLFVIVAVMHLILNFRQFLQYFRQRTGRVALGIGMILMILFLAIGLAHEENHRPEGYGPPEHAGAYH